MKNIITTSVLAIGLAATAADFNWPLISIRTNDRLDVPPEKFEPIFRVIAENPGCCDEIWFCCDGYRSGDFIARQAAAVRMREMCEKAGTRLSFQQGITLGHGVAAGWPPKKVETGDGVATAPKGLYPFTEDAWQVDRGGKRLFGLLCPRSSETAAFVHDYVKAVVENARPMTYWLDDDLRMGIHKPDGCFCDRCIAEFNRKNGTALSRQELVGRLYDKKTKHEPLRGAWCDFNAESLAVYGASAAKAIEETGSPCRLAYQSVWSDTIYTGRDYMPLLRAISGNGRRPTGIRPGACWYRDNQDGAAGIVLKCLSVAREAERCRSAGGIVGSVSYENETYPRHFLNKTPAAIITECAVAMASGSDAVSVYGYCTESFDPITEHEILFRRLAAARPYFERMRRESLTTRLGGIARYIGSRAAEMPDFDLRDEGDLILALMGVPVTCVESGAKAFYITRKSIAESTPEEIAAVRAKGALEGFDVGEFRFTPDAAARRAFLDKADSLVPGGMPVRLMDSRSIRVLPRVNAAGRTTAVTLFNTSFAFAEGFELRVRRPAGDRVAWMAPDGLKVDFSHARSGDEIVIRVKGLPGGAVGTYFFDSTVKK